MGIPCSSLPPCWLKAMTSFQANSVIICLILIWLLSAHRCYLILTFVTQSEKPNCYRTIDYILIYLVWTRIDPNWFKIFEVSGLQGTLECFLNYADQTGFHCKFALVPCRCVRSVQVRKKLSSYKRLKLVCE